MAGLVVGSAISAVSFVGTPVPPPQPGEINALVLPAMAPLYDGQAVQDVPGYAQMIAAGNFQSTMANIVSVVVSFTGDAVAGDDPLVEGESAGFTVTVTDAQGTQAVFVADPITVEYRVTVAVGGSNEIDLVINPLVADTQTISFDIEIDGQVDSYSLLAGTLRNNAANIAPPTLSGIPEAGEAITSDDGLWTSPTGVLTLSRQRQRDGVNIPGATGPEYVLTPEDEGTSHTVVVTADDGTHPALSISSAALDIPSQDHGTGGTGNAVVVTPLPIIISNESFTPAQVDLGAPVPGKQIIIVASWGEVSPATATVGLTLDLDGTQMSLLGQQISLAPPRDNAVAVQIGDASAGGVVTVNAALSNGEGNPSMMGVTLQPYLVENGTTTRVMQDENTSYGTLDLSTDVTQGAQILGAVRLVNSRATGDANLTGLTRTYDSDVGFYAGRTIHVVASPSETETRVMTAQPVGDGSGKVLAALVVIE